MPNPNVPNYEKPPVYNDPPSTPGSYNQLIPFYWQKNALIDLKKEQYFGQLASTIGMP